MSKQPEPPDFSSLTQWDDSAMQVVHVPVEELIPAPFNPRTITAKARKKLKGFIESEGFVEPILVQPETRYILGGNTRYDIAVELGYKTVPVIYRPGLSEARAKAYCIFLNNKEAQGEFVMSKLSTLLQEIDEAEDDPDLLNLTGYEGDDLTKIIGDVDDFVLEEVEVRPLPSMTWVLIGIPTVQFIDIAQEVERIRDLEGVFVDMVANDRAAT